MDPSETYQFHFRQHWMRMQHSIQGLVAGTLLYGVALWFLADVRDADTRHALLLAASVAYVLLHLSLLARLYAYILYIIVVTDAKVYRIKQTLLAVDERQTIDLWSLSDVTKRQHGIIQNLLGFGTMLLHGNEEIRVHFMPRIHDYVSRISGLRVDARSRMTDAARTQFKGSHSDTHNP